MTDTEIIKDYYQLMRSHEALKIKMRIQREQIAQLEIKLRQVRTELSDETETDLSANHRFAMPKMSGHA